HHRLHEVELAEAETANQKRRSHGALQFRERFDRDGIVVYGDQPCDRTLTSLIQDLTGDLWWDVVLEDEASRELVGNVTDQLPDGADRQAGPAHELFLDMLFTAERRHDGEVGDVGDVGRVVLEHRPDYGRAA